MTDNVTCPAANESHPTTNRIFKQMYGVNLPAGMTPQEEWDALDRVTCPEYAHPIPAIRTNSRHLHTLRKYVPSKVSH